MLTIERIKDFFGSNVMLRILVISNTTLKELREIAKLENCDLSIHAGEIGPSWVPKEEIKKLFSSYFKPYSEEEARSYLENDLQESFSCSGIFIPGNHDPVNFILEKYVENFYLVDDKIVEINGIRIYGYGGSLKDDIGIYFKNNYPLTIPECDTAVFHAHPKELLKPVSPVFEEELKRKGRVNIYFQKVQNFT